MSMINWVNFYEIQIMDSSLFIIMYLPSCSRTIGESDCPFFNELIINLIFVALWNSVLLIYLSILMLIPCVFNDCNLIVSMKSKSKVYSLQICFSFLSLCCCCCCLVIVLAVLCSLHLWMDFGNSSSICDKD